MGREVSITIGDAVEIRKRVIPTLYRAGMRWKAISAEISAIEGRVISYDSIYHWSQRFIPDLVDQGREVSPISVGNAKVVAYMTENPHETLASIAHNFGLTRECIRQISKKHGVVRPNSHIEKRKTKTAIASMVAGGASPDEAAETLGVSRRLVSTAMLENNITVASLRKEKIRKALVAVEGGSCYRAAGKLVGMSAAMVYHWCHKEGIHSKHGRHVSRAHRAETVLKMREDGRSWNEIAIVVSEKEGCLVQGNSLATWALRKFGTTRTMVAK